MKLRFVFSGCAVGVNPTTRTLVRSKRTDQETLGRWVLVRSVSSHVFTFSTVLLLCLLVCSVLKSRSEPQTNKGFRLSCRTATVTLTGLSGPVRDHQISWYPSWKVAGSKSGVSNFPAGLRCFPASVDLVQMIVSLTDLCRPPGLGSETSVVWVGESTESDQKVTEDVLELVGRFR